MARTPAAGGRTRCATATCSTPRRASSGRARPTGSWLTPFDPAASPGLPGGQLLAVLVARAARRPRAVRPHGRRRRGGRAPRQPLPLPARGAQPPERVRPRLRDRHLRARQRARPPGAVDVRVRAAAVAGDGRAARPPVALPRDPRGAAGQRRPRRAVGVARVVGARPRPGHAGRAVLRAGLAAVRAGRSCACRGGRRSPCRRPGRRSTGRYVRGPRLRGRALERAWLFDTLADGRDAGAADGRRAGHGLRSGARARGRPRRATRALSDFGCRPGFRAAGDPGSSRRPRLRVRWRRGACGPAGACAFASG